MGKKGVLWLFRVSFSLGLLWCSFTFFWRMCLDLRSKSNFFSFLSNTVSAVLWLPDNFFCIYWFQIPPCQFIHRRCGSVCGVCSIPQFWGLGLWCATLVGTRVYDCSRGLGQGWEPEGHSVSRGCPSFLTLVTRVSSPDTSVELESCFHSPPWKRSVAPPCYLARGWWALGLIALRDPTSLVGSLIIFLNFGLSGN